MQGWELRRGAVFTAGMVGLALLLAMGETAPAFTSAIDVTGAKLELHTAAPQRDTQQLIDVTLPANLIPGADGKIFATPLNVLMDQYWMSPDKKTGLIPHQTTCDGAPGQEGIKQTVVEQVAKIGSGFRAYDVVCTLVTTGSVFADQAGSVTTLAYQLTNNTVAFRVTSPYTCNPQKGGAAKVDCPNDAHVTVHFAIQLVTSLRAPDLCHISADQGTVYVVGASIHTDNLAADLAKLVHGDKFIGAEASIMSTVKQLPLPFDTDLAQIRNSPACTSATPLVSRVLTAFRQVDTQIDLQHKAIILRATHVGITQPQIGLPNPGGPPAPVIPSFISPEISTSTPLAKPGESVQVSGQYFPPNTNLASALPLTIQPGTYGNSSLGVCAAAGADLEWGPVNQVHVQRLPGDAQGNCPTHFDATGLTPNTAYQFRIRDCDLITCSPYSALAHATTARGDPNWGVVSLALDGGPQLATATVDARGTFSTSIVMPASTAPGTHTLHAVNHVNINGRDASATANIQVVSATAVTAPSFKMVGTLQGQIGCSAQQINLGDTDDTVMMSGSGFPTGTVTIHLDTITGFQLGSAPVGAPGTFCQLMNTPPAAQAGKHTLLAVVNGAVAAQLPATFDVPEVVK
jgi:hypothetical protein